MKVAILDGIDWESMHMTLHAESELSDEELENVRQLLDAWPEQQPPRRDGWYGSCPTATLDEIDDRKTLKFSWEKWFPEEWIEPLAAALHAEVPSLCLLEVGHKFEPPFRDDDAFIAVPEKVVSLEDGSFVHVQPFQIAKYTVSIAQFERFTGETGYKTIAERQDYATFRNNQFVSYYAPAPKRGPLPAYCISYRDALAYCAWAGVRLPSEAEWVAAAVIDDRVLDGDEFMRRVSELRGDPSALADASTEMTGTIIDIRFVIVRSGPYLVRFRPDMAAARNRGRQSLDECQDPVVFRVCK